MRTLRGVRFIAALAFASLLAACGGGGGGGAVSGVASPTAISGTAASGAPITGGSRGSMNGVVTLKDSTGHRRSSGEQRCAEV